jgi:hypothetical protein
MIAREPSRRLFLKQSVSGLSAASVAANYTSVLESEDFVQQAGAAAHLRVPVLHTRRDHSGVPLSRGGAHRPRSQERCAPQQRLVECGGALSPLLVGVAWSSS